MLFFSILAMTVSLHLVQLNPATIMAIGNNFNGQFDVATHGLVLAEQFQNVDLMANVQNGWTDFIHTGKAGTLAIGVVVGYMIRGITR
jgi:hypothetical protein